eukprot:jgi/Botrbrau1/16067/Bobra.7_2s0038.1
MKIHQTTPKEKTPWPGVAVGNEGAEGRPQDTGKQGSRGQDRAKRTKLRSEVKTVKLIAENQGECNCN